jgi:hypothetical protein
MSTHQSSGTVQRPTGRTYPLPTITTFHERTHEGMAYVVGDRSEALADDGALDILVSVNSAAHIHARFAATTGGDALVDLYENPFTDANSLGTPLTARNRFRYKGDNADSNHHRDPFTYANSLGTNIAPGIIAGGSKPFTAGGDVGDGFTEFMLSKGNRYLFRLTNKAGSAQVAGAEINFYERP